MSETTAKPTAFFLVGEKDAVYQKAHSTLTNFQFDESVANVFPDMIQRSVPGYLTIVENIGVIASLFAQKNTVLYDLGCSLGAVTMTMRHAVKQTPCRIIGIDTSQAMISRAQKYLQAQTLAQPDLLPYELLEADITAVEYLPCSVVALNFTLQFVDPAQREDLLARIFEQLCSGGVLVLSEKILFEEQETQQWINDMHIGFKRSQGYSELEIAQKRQALEKVMQIESIEQHCQRLYRIGFKRVEVWFQCFNFVSIIAAR